MYSSKSFVFFNLLVILGLLSVAESFLPLMSECDTDCAPESVPVCGNDGRTYDSRCDIEKAKCQGHPVEFKHRGKCVEKARCEAQRTLMLEQGHKTELFIPDCKPDGSYAEVQCHTSTGYCWCVDEAGKPVKGSSIQHERPNCAVKVRQQLAEKGRPQIAEGAGRRSTRRRSSRGKKNRKVCGSNERAEFNNNLIDTFESEYNRVPHTTTTTIAVGNDPLRDTHEKEVVQWKFDQLDDNGDSYLKKKELRDLRRMTKRIVKPKVCAKTFAKYCDLDQDKKISRSEWSVCVGVDINISFRLFMSLNSDEQVNGVDDFLDDAPKAEDDPTTTLPVKAEPWDRSQTMPRLRHDGHSSLKEDGADEDSKEEGMPLFQTEPQDCNSARHIAQESHRQDPAAGIYIPECTPEGLYVRAQCHRSPQYCWCVHPRTGRPIKGTATQGIKPDCDNARRGVKNFKGCSLHKKQEFLDELVQSFIKEMIEDAKNRSLSIDTPTAEKAARWKFSSIDVNNNSVLDKREWKIFKKEWRSFQKDSKQKKRLRKCWRNLPRFCDENDNQKITMDEWLACTSITRDSKGVLPRNQQRRGKNPFSTILKSD
ncbi:SPARC-related modular calcium-binding protein 1-like isoform X3 [Stegodyphus dumicola]|uniref:SPARC-related modular calcium-binding protein 1-like isoform X3 n=1 Tax=Stegodyphus dumicola TaxID=202533 RepID=UPI0015AA19DD|nr:SPARC-related modular calcium-binding protein 1-like isoform X3 [Stegodyphus dumicola]